MRLDESKPLRPKILYTVEAEEQVPVGVSSQRPEHAGLKKSRKLWKVIAGSLLLAVGVTTCNRYFKQPESVAWRKLVSAATARLQASPHVQATPPPIVAQIEADMVRVTAISLGHPRIAIINGKQVAEGDAVIVHVPNYSVEITLRVLKISDGRIELSDGTQTFSVQLTIPQRQPR